MNEISVFFKNEEIYQNAKVGFYIKAYFYKNKVLVQIDDLSKSTWQLPLLGIKETSNPKIKEYTLEEFNKHYHIPK